MSANPAEACTGALGNSRRMVCDNEPSAKRSSPPRIGHSGLWRIVYWAGRTCQAIGLLLLWWVLLLFPAVEDLRVFPYVGLAAAGAVFCVGWLIVRRAAGPARQSAAIERQKASSDGANADQEDTLSI